MPRISDRWFSTWAAANQLQLVSGSLLRPGKEKWALLRLLALKWCGTVGFLFPFYNLLLPEDWRNSRIRLSELSILFCLGGRGRRDILALYCPWRQAPSLLHDLWPFMCLLGLLNVEGCERHRTQDTLLWWPQPLKLLLSLHLIPRAWALLISSFSQWYVFFRVCFSLSRRRWMNNVII